LIVDDVPSDPPASEAAQFGHSGECVIRCAVLHSTSNEPNRHPVALEPGSQPLLTAIMVMPRSFQLLTASISCLGRQSIKEHIELVIVHTPAFQSSIDRAACVGFHSVRMVSIDRMPTVAAGFVAGVAAASAPVVGLVEDHVFLHPQWAERVVNAHREGCAAVVPRMTNGNPGTVASWANFLTCFSEPFAMRSGGSVESGPGHNTSYKRAVLHSYCDDLQSLYQSERNFHYRLKQDGHRIVAEPRAELAHVNISIPRKVLSHAFYGGVVFGQYRSASMGLGERFLRTIFAPLVPPLRTWRIARTLGLRQLVNPDGPRAALLVAPVLLIAHATGEVAGYWRLVRHVEARYEHYELHRVECIRQDERSLLTERRLT
jgi:hypothetical protein